MKTDLKILIFAFLLLLVTNQIEAQDATKAHKDSLDTMVKNYYELNLKIFQAKSTKEDIDAAQSTINSLSEIAAKYGDQIEIMMDSGLRSGPDIARTMASGAKFTFMGRSFLYGCGALGNQGGDHTISMLKTQFKQVMDQLCCERVEDLPKHLIMQQKNSAQK